MIHENPPESPFTWSAEASDIGFIVGLWPHSFVWNSQTFKRLATHKDSEGDLMWVTYINSAGKKMQVFND